MKLQQLQEEIEQTIEDKVERSKVMEGTLGDILNSTQVWIVQESILCSMITRSSSNFLVFIFNINVMHAGSSSRATECCLCNKA